MIDDSKKLAMIYQAVGLAGGPEQTVEEHLEHCDLHFLRVLQWIFDKEVPERVSTGTSLIFANASEVCTELKPICNCQGQ